MAPSFLVEPTLRHCVPWSTCKRTNEGEHAGYAAVCQMLLFSSFFPQMLDTDAGPLHGTFVEI